VAESIETSLDQFAETFTGTLENYQLTTTKNVSPHNDPTRLETVEVYDLTVVRNSETKHYLFETKSFPLKPACKKLKHEFEPKGAVQVQRVACLH
jgi:hypothetical protein